MPSIITGDDNHIALLAGRTDVARCPTCKIALHPFDHGFPTTQVPKKSDISICVEGFCLVSPELRDMLERNTTSRVDFIETGGGYFVARPQKAVYEDMTPRPHPQTGVTTPVVSEDFCQTCGRFNAFHGVGHGILPGQEPVEDFDLVRSAQAFGPKGQKMFHMIAGDGLSKALKNGKFRGLHVTEFGYWSIS